MAKKKRCALANGLSEKNLISPVSVHKQIDVALMWTVHMLAPFRYHEDLLRSYGPHLLNYYFPLERYVSKLEVRFILQESGLW